MTNIEFLGGPKDGWVINSDSIKSGPVPEYITTGPYAIDRYEDTGRTSKLGNELWEWKKS